MSGALRNITPGRERFPPGHAIRRHRHHHAYALVTLAGSMRQAGYAGRLATRPGQLLVQPTLDAHANRTSAAGVQILRLPWRECEMGGLYELDDIDLVVRMAERDPLAASELAFEQVANCASLPAMRCDWEDLLADDIARGAVTSLREWARSAGLAPETLSRGFARRFHCTPARFRLELRTREAWLRVVGTNQPLAGIAADAGFADQAHMSRAMARLTGRPPGNWRSAAP